MSTELGLNQNQNQNHVTVEASANMGEVARVLAERHLKKAPVVENGKMVGVINRSNITKYSVRHYFEAGQTAQ